MNVMSNLQNVMYFGLKEEKVEGIGKVWSKYESYDHIGIA